MRHRASRPLADLWQRLTRAAAFKLEKAAERLPLRALVIVTVTLGLGVGGYAAIAAVMPDSSNQQTETAVDTSSREAAQPQGTPQSPESDDERSEGSSPKPGSSAPGQPKSESQSPNDDETPSQPTEQGDVTDSPSTGSEPPSTHPSGPSSASRTGEDTTPPSTTLSEEYPEPDSARFSFSADEAASFTCSLDGAAYSSCDSPTLYSNLDPGWHTFSVRATDSAGNVDPSPASTRWHASKGEGQP